MAEMLAKEKEKNLRMQEKYRKELAQLPKGSILPRKRGSYEYFEINVYCPDAKRGVLKHIGKDKAVVDELRQKINRRRYLEKEIRELNRELETIERMLRPAQKHLEQPSLRDALKTAEEGRNSNTPPPNNAPPERK